MSALPLLVLGGAAADHAHHTPSLDDAATLTDRLDTRTNLHAGSTPALGFMGQQGKIAAGLRGRNWAGGTELGRAPRAGRPGQHSRCGAPGFAPIRLLSGAHGSWPMAAVNSRYAAAGSSASVIGRPTTRCVAPAATAASGVAMRR